MARTHMPWHPYARRDIASQRRQKTFNDAFNKYVPRRSASSRYAGGFQVPFGGQVPSFRNTRPPADKAVWQYRNGMRTGRGVAMDPEEVDRLDKGSGKGTLSDPKILYNTKTDGVSRVLLEQCEKVAKDEARRLGMTCAIIRGDLHNTTRTLDIYTREIIMVEDPTNPGKMIPLLEPIDDHLTIAFGSVRYDPTTFGTDNIVIQGHLFVNVEREPESTSWTNNRHESGLILSKPLWDMSKDFDAGLARITGKLPPWKRRHIQEGYEECSEEYWERGTSLKRNPYNWRFKR